MVAVAGDPDVVGDFDPEKHLAEMGKPALGWTQKPSHAGNHHRSTRWDEAPSKEELSGMMLVPPKK